MHRAHPGCRSRSGVIQRSTRRSVLLERRGPSPERIACRCTSLRRAARQRSESNMSGVEKTSQPRIGRSTTTVEQYPFRQFQETSIHSTTSRKPWRTRRLADSLAPVSFLSWCAILVPDGVYLLRSNTAFQSIEKGFIINPEQTWRSRHSRNRR